MDKESLFGQIIAHHGVAVEVAFQNGDRSKVRVSRQSGHVVGDEVEVKGERLYRQERRSALHRRAPGTQGVQVIASNLTHLGIVSVCEPPPRTGFIDRAIVLARIGDISPFLIVNKMDLAGSQKYLETVQEEYGRALDVFSVSAKTGQNLDQLEAYLSHHEPSVLIGPSGVGKSSLTNRLIPESNLITGSLSEATGRGRHTTSTATLQKNGSGIILVDTPGVRDYGLIELTSSELAQAFPGFEQIEDPCRFRNCRHIGEPGCAIEAHLATNPHFVKRLDMYRQLLSEIETNGNGPKSKGKAR
jgi:ribosome biogenesis GTPase / thiamine phosphate phosphatase